MVTSGPLTCSATRSEHLRRRGARITCDKEDYLGHMSRALGFVVSGLAVWQACGQNLVPNPGFEIYANCPTNPGQGGVFAQWMIARGSPDCYNACDTTNMLGVPYSWIGYQPAFSGDGHMGVATYLDSNFWGGHIREFLAVELLEPLQIGESYLLSFRAAAGLGGPVASPMYVSNGIGLAFRTAFFSQSSAEPVTINPVLAYSPLLSDSATWTLVEDCFTADSAYTHLFVGNFLPFGSVSFQLVDTSGNNPCSYAYVDEVTVILDPTCGSTGGAEIPELSVDAHGTMTIQCPDGAVPLIAEIWDLQGRLSARWTTEATSLNGSRLPCDHLPKGIYVLHVASSKWRACARFLR